MPSASIPFHSRNSPRKSYIELPAGRGGYITSSVLMQKGQTATGTYANSLPKPLAQARPVKYCCAGGSLVGRLRLFPLWLFCFLFCSVPSVFAQDGSSSGTQAVDFPMPATTGTLGTKVPNALAEITAHLQVVSATGWQDLEATGTLSLSKDDVHSATLSLSGSAYSRLDITMDSGTRSLRIADSKGKFVDEKGNKILIHAETARAGIVAFPRLWTGAATAPDLSILDRGDYAGTGQVLHRITLEYPIFSKQYSPGDPTAATDLYFDPTTHLLLFSVNAVSVTNLPGKILIRVTSYSGYQQFGQFSVPTSIQQTLSGQVLWKLQLNEITTNTNPPASTFSF